SHLLMERKLVTVLFADAMGSTSLADRLDPERLRTVLDSYFAAMAGAVDSWGGTVEKFIGDAVMAVFGVPAVREDDAERALSAAMEMMERLEELNKELQALDSLLDEVLEARRPRLVTVLGPAGVGKSRLVHEFVAGVRAQHPNARVLRGRCLAAGHGITFWALGEILRAACGIRLDDPA